MPKFRKKPVVIEAVQMHEPFEVETLEGTMRGAPGDWLITGVKDEQYPCKDDIFRATYEAESENSCVTVPRGALEWWRELASLNPADLIPRISRVLS